MIIWKGFKWLSYFHLASACVRVSVCVSVSFVLSLLPEDKAKIPVPKIYSDFADVSVPVSAALHSMGRLQLIDP